MNIETNQAVVEYATNIYNAVDNLFYLIDPNDKEMFVIMFQRSDFIDCPIPHLCVLRGSHCFTCKEVSIGSKEEINPTVIQSYYSNAIPYEVVIQTFNEEGCSEEENEEEENED